MAANLHSFDPEEDDYIDMEVSSHFNQTVTSPPHPREFEFQMFSTSLDRETTPSPADELFYKGKLLPLHLPPRVQMVEKLLQNTHNHKTNTSHDEEHFSTPLTSTTTTNTPFESCSVSPSQSCHVSRELNPDEYFYHYSAQLTSFIGEHHHPNKSWTQKLKLIKKSSIGSKLKSSKAYLKTLFSKSDCSDQPSMAETAKNIDERSVSKKYTNIVQKKNQTIATKSFNKEKIATDCGGRHRRSFSGAIKRFSKTKSSSSSSCSSSSSSSSNGFRALQYVKRSSSGNPDIENSIQGAIAYCKRSQQQFHSRKTVSEAGFYSLSASIVCEDQERPVLCRG